MKYKRITALFMAFLLVMPAFLVSAEQNKSSEEKTPGGEGSYSEKHEVVYATLNASGNQEEMYGVNNFSIEEPGKIVDHGSYTSVQNLTDLTDIDQNDNRVELTAKEDEFYYQGNLEDTPLPWNIDVSYKLDGEELQPEELLGKDGEFEIQIDTEKNEDADPAFFENYLMQITLTLDSKLYENIEAPDGTVANAGKNRQVTFTAMPEKEGSFTLSADVTDLEMESIEMVAIPSSMSIDAPDTGAVTDDMNSLSNATSELNQGVGELKQGIAELNDGAAVLYDGSAEYKNGIGELDNGSAELVKGSASIQSALQKMSESVGAGSGEMNLSDLSKMEDGIRQVAEGLKEAENGLSNLKEQYGKAHGALGETIESIPAYNITEEQIQVLYESGADKEVVDQLVETHQTAAATKETYANVKEVFNAVDPALETSAGSLNEMSSSLSALADNLASSLDSVDIDESMKELQEGLQTLSSNYNNFHSGLTDYTGGVSELAGSYQEIHNGLGELSNGTSELENGAAELHNGTSELAESTSDIPGQMQSEIDQMVEEYDKSDFEPVSFVSSENEKVESVQFVIKTESIKKPEKEEEAPKEKEEKSFWDRFIDLFK
ncbi:YhgE/Pip domain-containing protein [Halobacillus sp. Marseille-Q1614]|uniref:YhgE/Pip domain-containing protein n=1 Tax=Halobacillus sp. Marseille-Q1614 TaxID=2709134 RepID=UPI0035301E51